MPTWTDTKSKTVSVGGAPPPPENKVVIDTLDIPSSAQVNQYVNFTFICHIYSGTCKAAMALANNSGNPGNIVVYVDGATYEVPPGYMLLGTTDAEWSQCTRVRLGSDTRIMFKATGNYTLTFYAGYV